MPAAHLIEIMRMKGLMYVGQWPTLWGWNSNGARPRTVPVSSVATLTSPMPFGPSAIRTGSSLATAGGNGEDRYRLLGRIDGRLYVVVYAVRGLAVRIISARKANGKEVADFEHNARQNRSRRSVHSARGADRPRQGGRHQRGGDRSAGAEG